MLELFTQLQQNTAVFDPMVLVLPGLAALIAGLFTWLGGLDFRKPLFAVSSAAAAAAPAFIISSQLQIALIAAVIAAAIALLLEKLFTVALTAVLVAAVSFLVITAPLLDSTATDPPTATDKTTEASVLTPAESLACIENYASDVGKNLASAARSVPAYKWLLAVLALLIAVAASIYLPGITLSLCFSVLGTAFIFAGMIFMLLYKGSQPITRIYNSADYYLMVFAAMAAFGCLVQLFFCNFLKKRKNQPQPDQPQSEQTKQNLGYNRK